MAGLIEMVNGVGSFVSYRDPAWHNLGTVLEDEFTLEEGMRIANLAGWNVRCEPVIYPDGYTASINKFMMVRNHPEDGHPDVLAINGERYEGIQNEDALSWLGELGLRIETLGSIRNGRQVFATAALDREVVLDPTGVADVIKTYLVANTSHDGSLAISGLITPTRVVCANTQAIALGNYLQRFTIRHTESALSRLADARDGMLKLHGWMDAFEVEAKTLFEKSITKAQFDEIVSRAFPMPEKDAKGSMKKWETKTDLVQELYTAPTNVMIAGTAWGAYQTLTEHLDYYSNPRKGNTEIIAIKASGMDDNHNAKKNNLLSIVKSVAFA
jgi:phage/plasmid-like protein (TIGR03299 family)